MSRSDFATDLTRRLEPLESVGRRAGVEHEYRIHDKNGLVDFKHLVEAGGFGCSRLDPGDPNAARLAWGGVITADGAEAEVVTPPVTWGPGSFTLMADLSAAGASELRSRIEAAIPGANAVGYSTHLNFEVRDAGSVRVAQRLIRYFSSSLALLVEQQTSPGLLLRPRYGRIEVGGEYMVGEQLRAAATFAAAATIACQAPIRGRRHLPPTIHVRSQHDNQRYGWFISRYAFGKDLYELGRRAPVRTVRGTRSAGDLLEDAWENIRPLAATFSSAGDLALVDRTVSGDLPIPLEHVGVDGAVRALAHSPAHGRIVDSMDRSGYRLQAIHATWESTVFEISSRESEPKVINVPDCYLTRFVEMQSTGRLDDLLGRVAASGPLDAVLSSFDQVGSVGVFDSVSHPAVLAPPERDVSTGRSGGNGSESRRNKRQQRPPLEPRRSRRPALVAAVTLVLLIVAAVVLLRPNSTDEAGSPPVTTAQSTPPTSTTERNPTTTEGKGERSGTIEGPGTATAQGNSTDGFPLVSYTVGGQPQPLLAVIYPLNLKCTTAGCAIVGAAVDNDFDGIPEPNDLHFTGARATGTVVRYCSTEDPPGQLTFDVTFSNFVQVGQVRVPTSATGRVVDNGCGQSEAVYDGTTGIEVRPG